MKPSKSLFVVAVALALMALSCDRKPLPVEATPVVPDWNAGSADFTRYVAIGNSLTAGFQSNALSQRDQAYSYPNLLSAAFRIPAANFQQPLIRDPGIGARKKLNSFTLTATGGVAVIVDEVGVNPFDPASNLNGSLARPYNNLGIPGAVLFDMLDTTNFTSKSIARANPFFAQILRSNALFGRSIVAQARALSPTFMTCWIGNNDVLGYATSGGVSPSSPTPAATFNALYTQLMDSLRSITPNVVVANIPDVTTIPFFSTVPWNGLALTRQGQVDSLNAAYRPAGISFTLGANGWIIAVSGVPGFRKMTSSEFVCLTIPQDSLRLAGWGSVKPIPNQYILTSTEIATAQAAVNNYNASIDSLARNRGFAVVNMNAALKDLAARGRSVPGYGTFTSQFISGGAFSYDGVHPSSRGAVIMANEFIKVINAKYGAAVTPVDMSAAPQLQGLGKEAVSGGNGPAGGQFGSFDYYPGLLRAIGR